MKRVFIGDLVIGDEERNAINDVLSSGRISEGVKTREFEQEWSRYIGTNHTVAVNSGTSGLVAGLYALKNHPRYKNKIGKRIITSPVTYIATSNAIVASGFEPEYVDIDRERFSIIPEQIERAVKKNPEDYFAILPVHLMGYPNDMDSINEIAEKYDLAVFEDSAQAHGSLYHGKKCGSLGHLADFSFYIAHNIQAGELGAVTTNDKDIARLVKKIKANGRMCDCPVCTRNTDRGCPRINSYTGKDDFDPRFTHDMVGFNFKTMDLQTSIALTQLKRADWIMGKRQENVRYLNEELSTFSGILQLPEYSEEVSYLAYPLIIKRGGGVSRKELRSKLEKRGIENRPLFGCIPTQQPAYSWLKSKYEGRLPNAEYIGANGFYVGCHQYLKQEDLEHIVTSFKEILK